MGNSQVALSGSGELTVRIYGEFGFDIARNILSECRSFERTAIRGITVRFFGVTYLDSCGIGALSMLQDMAGSGGFSMDISSSSPHVRHMFDSKMFDRFVHPDSIKRCTACYDSGTPTRNGELCSIPNPG